jgi:rubrerythrin
MVLSREEIEQIAKRTADEVIDKLISYPPKYKEPESVEEGLVNSIGEEHTAEEWYRKRAAHAATQGDALTYALYQHIADEEHEHKREFGQRLQEVASVAR